LIRIPFWGGNISKIYDCVWNLGGPQQKKQMKNPDRETVSRLDELPNIGKAMADDLYLIGIDHPKKHRDRILIIFFPSSFRIFL